jgi:ABC-type amino acid transport substrate-binding protein
MIRFFLTAFLCILCSLPVNAKESVFEKVVSSGELNCAYAIWPPFFSKDALTGELSGFNYDIIEAVGRELGLKINWSEEVGFGNYIEGLRSGRYDAMCQTVWPDPARFKNALVTIPAHYHKVHVVVRADDTRFDDGWRKLNDPQFKAVVVDGDITDTIARTDFPKATIVSLPQAADARQMFTEIETKKADATFVDYGFFKDYDSKNPGKLKLAGNVLRVYGSVFSVPNGETELKMLLDNALIALINSGRIEEILRKHPTTAMAPAPTYTPLEGQQ